MAKINGMEKANKYFRRVKIALKTRIKDLALEAWKTVLTMAARIETNCRCQSVKERRELQLEIIRKIFHAGRQRLKAQDPGGLMMLGQSTWIRRIQRNDKIVLDKARLDQADE